MILFLVSLMVIWRIGLWVIAAVAQHILPFVPRFPYADALLIPSGFPPWIWSFANFDGVHYLTIIKSGYSAQFTQVFFPLYPILVRIISVLFGRNLIISALIVSHASFFGALYIFILLLQLDKVPHIKWVLLMVVISPFSFFFGSVYTESLFLLLVLGSFLAARQKRWMLAGLLGGLASATRITGIFLLPALLWEQYYEKLKMKKFKVDTKSLIEIIRTSFISPILYLAPSGLIAYMVYLQWKFGDFLYFWHAQPVFGAQRSGSKIILPLQVIWRYCKIIFTVPYASYDFWVAIWEVGAFVFALCVLYIAMRQKVRSSYLIFSLLAILIPSFSGTFSSMPRYILVVFPIYIILGTVRNVWFKIIMVGISTMLLIIFTSLFTRGLWVS